MRKIYGNSLDEIQAGPVYVAAALEWVEIGPTLQERRGSCNVF